MKTRSLPVLLALTATLLIPALAAGNGQDPAPANPAPLCGEPAAPLAGVAAAPAPAADVLGLSPLAGAVQMANPNCCANLQRQCENNCRNKQGVFEFNCFPDNCTASCICNVFP